MSVVDRLKLADGLLPAVLSAGQALMRHYDSDLTVEHKNDQTPVTAADRESEDIIVAQLADLEPQIPIIAEERVAAGQVPAIEDCFFLVDALDGTREFIKRRGEFTINVGLIAQGAPVFGLIYAPVLKRLFVTTEPTTALEFEIAPNSTAKKLSGLSARKLSACGAKRSEKIAFASRSHAREETDAFIAQQGACTVQRVGSSLKFCLIARGVADLYPRLGPTSEWDTAAGHAILATAGGQVARLDGQSFQYGKVAQRFINPGFIAWGANTTPKFACTQAEPS